MKEGGHFGEIPEVSEVPDLINLHNSCHFPHVPEVLERMPEGMPIVLEWISEARSEVGSAGSNYFGVLPGTPGTSGTLVERSTLFVQTGWVVYGAI